MNVYRGFISSYIVLYSESIFGLVLRKIWICGNNFVYLNIIKIGLIDNNGI